MPKLDLYLTKNITNALKIISALMVVICHYSQYVCSRGFSDLIILKAFAAQGGYLGVAIFFFLSGYGLMESESKSHLSSMAFFKRRFLKVYLPVLFVTALWMFLSPLLLSGTPFHGYDIKVCENYTLTIGNLFWDFADEVLWFIKVLIVLYAGFYIYTLFRLKNRQVSIIFLLMTCALTTVWTNYYVEAFAAVSVPFFYLGVIISFVKGKEQSVPIILLCLFVFVISLFVAFDRNIALHGLIDIFVVSFILLTLSLVRLDFYFPTFLGVISFDIYLVHNKVLMIL